MERNFSNDDHEEEEIIKRPKNYPFCHNSDTIVNTNKTNDKPKYDTVNLYKYC